MATQAEIDQARAAGARAAAEAQRIADAAEPSLLDRVEASVGDFVHGITDPITGAIRDTTQTADNAANAVTDTAKEFLNVLKWIAIVVLVFVAILALLWLSFAVFGFVWAGKVLTTIAPSLATGAVAAARVAR